MNALAAYVPGPCLLCRAGSTYVHNCMHPLSPCVCCAFWHLHLSGAPQVAQCEVHQVKHHIHVALVPIVQAAAQDTTKQRSDKRKHEWCSPRLAICCWVCQLACWPGRPNPGPKIFLAMVDCTNFSTHWIIDWWLTGPVHSSYACCVPLQDCGCTLV